MFLVLIVLSITTVAEGADWVLLAEGKRGTSVFVDNESIRHISKNIVRAWSKFVKREPVKYESKFIKEIVRYEEWHCTQKKHKLLLAMHIYTDRTSASAEGKNEDWRYFLPDSLDSVIFEYLCKNDK